MDMKNQPNKATVKDGLPTAKKVLAKHYDVDNRVDEAAIAYAMEQYAELHTQAFRERVKELEGKVSELRTAFANYHASEGCSCCRDSDNHRDAEHAIGELLGVAKHDDESGYDFNQYQTIYK